MGKRGYLLLKANFSTLNEDSVEDQIWNFIKKVEEIDDIEYASNTIGEYDFLISIDTLSSIESIAEKVKNIKPQWIKDITPLTENNIFKKHREIKDLSIFKNIH